MFWAGVSILNSASFPGGTSPEYLTRMCSLIPPIFLPQYPEKILNSVLNLEPGCERVLKDLFHVMSWPFSVDLSGFSALSHAFNIFSNFEFVLMNNRARFEPLLREFALLPSDDQLPSYMSSDLGFFSVLFARLLRLNPQFFASFFRSPFIEEQIVVDDIYKALLVLQHPLLSTRPPTQGSVTRRGFDAGGVRFLADVIEQACEFYGMSSFVYEHGNPWGRVCMERTLLAVFESLPAKEFHLLIGRGFNSRTDEETRVFFLQGKFGFQSSPGGGKVGIFRRVRQIPIEVQPLLKTLCLSFKLQGMNACRRLEERAKHLEEGIEGFEEKIKKLRQNKAEVEFGVEKLGESYASHNVNKVSLGFEVDFKVSEAEITQEVYSEEILRTIQHAYVNRYLRTYWPALERVLNAETVGEQVLEVFALKSVQLTRFLASFEEVCKRKVCGDEAKKRLGNISNEELQFVLDNEPIDALNRFRIIPVV